MQSHNRPCERQTAAEPFLLSQEKKLEKKISSGGKQSYFCKQLASEKTFNRARIFLSLFLSPASSIFHAPRRKRSRALNENEKPVSSFFFFFFFLRTRTQTVVEIFLKKIQERDDYKDDTHPKSSREYMTVQSSGRKREVERRAFREERRGRQTCWREVSLHILNKSSTPAERTCNRDPERVGGKERDEESRNSSERRSCDPGRTSQLPPHERAERRLSTSEESFPLDGNYMLGWMGNRSSFTRHLFIVCEVEESYRRALNKLRSFKKKKTCSL